MKCDHTYSSMIIQQIDHLIQRILQNIQFMIQFNADCLISLLGWMTTLGSDLRRNSSPDNIIEFPGCLDWLFLSGHNDMLGNIACKLIFTIISDHMKQFCFCIIIHNVSGCLRLTLIHAHIKNGIFSVSKSSLNSVQLIRGYAKIEYDSIHTINAQICKNLRHCTIIAADNGHFVAKWCQPVSGCFYCCCILVDTDQPPLP